MIGLDTLSELAGYTSIACWLGAQFPQVLENFRRQSCEGLALPFLANWFLGDLSNLIGCILTHQLPFQTYLATYFVFVDLSLVVQYFYYLPKQASASLARTRGRPTSTLRRRSTDGRSVPRYRTLSAVAANVAAAAALAAQHEEYAHPRRDRGYRPRSVSLLHERSVSHVSGSRPSGDDGNDNDADDEAVIPSAMLESFRSEGGGERTHQKRHWWQSGTIAHSSVHHSLHFTESSEPFPDASNRGRSRQRSPSLVGPPSARKSSRASHRGAGMVFLGVWALFGLGSLAGSPRGAAPVSVTSVGTLLAFRSMQTPRSKGVIASTKVSTPPPELSTPVYVHVSSLTHDSDSRPQHSSVDHPLTSEQVLGRIFAWLCTTLYLTSRLPQIWKNFARKSVEGLSMYLFVFAFLGNCFYVTSILLSPKVRQPLPISEAFLKESLPYLLGSGGTLMFDVTIVSQSFIYRPKQRRHHRNRTLDEEEATGLLGADTLANPEPPSHAPHDDTHPHDNPQPSQVADSRHLTHLHHTIDASRTGATDAAVHVRGRASSSSS